MTLILKNRVKETTATVGLGTISLGGSSDTFEPFSTIGTGNTTYYAIVAHSSDNWEVGVGTVGSGTLSRDIVLASSNLNAKVNFPAGTKDVFVTFPANKIVSKDDATGINSGISLADYVDFDTAADAAGAVGRLKWNDQDGTLDLGVKGGNVTLQVGQEQLIRVVNKAGASLLEANYQCVKISGAQGQRPKVALAQADNDLNSADTIGLVTETIANNQEGFVTTSGIVRNINTTGSLQGESWNDGDVLYLSGTVAGRLTNVKPQAPIHTVIVGFVIYAHANQGKIFVKVDNGYELDELHNVNITSPSNGQVLTYNNGLWENQTNGSGTVTSVSVVSANGLSGSVANSTTTPAITLSTSVSGLLKGSAGALAAASATDVPELPQSKITNLVSDLAAKAPLASPALTGTPTAPTAAVGTNTTQVATTAFVNAEIANDAPSKTGTGASGTWGIDITGNANTVDGYHVQVDGTGTDPNTIYFKTTGGVDPSAAVWGDITGSIVDQTDLYNALVNGTYATGNWNINADTVDGYNVQVDGTGTDPNTIYFKTTGGTISVDWDDVANTPTTVSGYGITDAVTTSGNQTIGGTKTFSSTITGSITGNADTVDGYNVQVDGTGTDPNTIYFKTTGGTISVDWDDVSNTPTTVAGYGITDVFTETESDARFLGISATAVNSDKIDGYHVQVDGTGTDPNTIYFKTTGGTTSVEWGNISGTLSAQTDLQTALDGKYSTSNPSGYITASALTPYAPINNPTFTGTVSGITKAMVGLGNVDNTADAVKSVSYATSSGNADTVDGYNVQVDGTGTDPNTIYFKTTGGSVSVEWDDVSNTPTTVSGYGITDAVTTSGDQTVGGTKTFSSTITGSITGNAGTVTNGVYTSGDQTIGGNKTFSSTIIGSVSGNAGTVTNGVYTSGDQTIGGTKTFSSTISGSIDGNSNTVDGYHVQVDGAGTDPNTIYFKTTGGGIGVDWDDISNTPTTVAGYGITDAVTTSGNQTIGGVKTFSSTITGSITGNAGTVTNGVYTSGDQTIGGTKTFSGASTIVGGNFNLSGGTANGVAYLNGSKNLTTGSTLTFNGSVLGMLAGAGPELRLSDSSYYSFIKSAPVGANSTLVFGVNAAEQMRLTSTGLGIGTTSPVSKLHVAGNALLSATSGYKYLYFNFSTENLTTRGAKIGKNYDSPFDLGIWASTHSAGNGSATVFYRDLTTESMRIDSSGNVGIGTTSPVSKLEVKGTGFVASSISGDSTSETQLRFNTNTGARVSQQANQALIFDTNATERMRINSAGNVGIGTTSPTSARLVVVSPANSPSLLLTDNTQSTLTVKHESGNLLTYEVNGTATQRWVGNGSERMRINSAGNVGIGTTSPTYRLTVANNSFDGVWAESSGTYSFVGLGGYFSGSAGSAQIGYERSTGAFVFGNGTRDVPTERMRIDGSGKVLVGAGATASLGKLVVSEASSGTAVIALESQGSWNSQISSTSAGNMIFSNGTTERLRIDASGNVGIGNNNPIFKLDVNGSFRVANDGGGGYGGLWTMRNTASGATNPDKNFRINATGTLEIINNAYNSILLRLTDSGTLLAGEAVQAPIYYDVNNTAFYVDPNGTSNINALVMNGLLTGRSSASTNVNTANDTGSISIRGSSTTVASMSFNRTGTYAINMGLGTDNVFRIGGWSASNNCLQMDGSGNLTMLNNVTAYSDARLKTDVVKIENALDKVQQLNGYTYTRTDTGSKQTGVIAQEVMKVLPEVVMGSEDTHYSVAYGNMVGLLIEAIKEQQGQINELKLTIEQLKGN